MWVCAAYTKQAKEQLDLPCPEERKSSPQQAKPHVWPRSPDSSEKLSFLDTEDHLTFPLSKPQS